MPNNRSIPPPPGTRLTLVTLGGAALSYSSAEQGVTTALRPGKAIALVVYLACSPRRTASREHLIDLLWADAHPDLARRALRQTVWFIRHRVGEDTLLGSDAELTLAGTVRSDRDEFLEAVEHGDLEHAVALYHGDFLPLFAAPGGAEFEQWADLERQRLRLAFIRAAEALIRNHLSRARWRDAEQLARRLRDTDPTRQSRWRLLIESYLSANDPLRAAIEADGLEQMLAAEHREPEPATRTLLALVREKPDEGPSGPQQRSLVAELVGREQEFSRIIRAWDAACKRPGRHVHVSAGAGLGKTRLLSDIHARLRASGARAIYVRASPGGRHLAYSFVSDLAAALAALPGSAGVSPAASGALVALNPSLSSLFSAAPDQSVGEEALRHRTIALSELLEAVADEHSVALLIDDIHWADAQSRQIVRSLLEKSDEVRSLVVTAARPTPEGRVEVPATERLELPPLSAHDVSALLVSLGNIPAAPWADALPTWLHTATGGSPLLIMETFQMALERGSLVLSAEGWECADPAVLAAELEAGEALRHRIEQLAPGQRSLLLLLAVAGTPITTGLLARAADRTQDAAQPDLDTLEQRGIISRATGDWEPGHDEIAALALELADDGTLHPAHAALGRALVREGDGDVRQLIRGGRHLAAAEAEPELVTVYRRLVTASRRLGDRRPPAELAAELLGEARSPARIRRLAASLPIHVRLGLTTGRRVAAAAVLVLATLAAGTAALVKPNRPVPDAVLIAVARTDDGGGTVYTVPIYRDGWEDLASLDVRARGKRRTELATLARQNNPVFGPDGKSWVFNRTMPDSGELDLFLATDDGREIRLTTAPGDDTQQSWGPDGGRLVFGTTRWSPRHRQDLAILELETGGLHSVTRSDNSDRFPNWSPDGSRIAFMRGYYQMRPPELCWVTLDGRIEQCKAPSGYRLDGVLGWYDQRQVLVLLDSAQQSMLARFDVESAAIQVVDRARGVGTWEVSGDGRWAAYFGERPGYAGAAWYVFPVDRPDLIARVEFGAKPAADFFLLWNPQGRSRRYLDRVELSAPLQGIPLDVSHRLEVHGFDTAGEPMALPVLSWRSGDTTIATVDSPGIVHPRSLGTVTIQVSTGGWREDSVLVTIQPPGFVTLLKESWTDDFAGEWVAFGIPQPTLSTGPQQVSALWHRGDSTYHSGVYSRRAFGADRGLGIEALISTPIDALQWQSLTIILDANLDVDTLAAWDHRTGSLPSGTGAHTYNFHYPRGDGFLWLARIALGAGTAQQLVPVEDWVRSGRWYTVRLQIFPDGRCAFALNGKPLWRGESTLSLDRPFRVGLSGKSVGTKILVGPLQVWEGVRGDVDWGLLDRGEGR